MKKKIVMVLIMTVVGLTACGSKEESSADTMTEQQDVSLSDEGTNSESDKNDEVAEVSMEALMNHDVSPLEYFSYWLIDDSEEYGKYASVNVKGCDPEDPIIVFPEEIEGYPVKVVDAESGSSGVKAIYIPDSVVEIPRGSFDYKENLEYVYIGKGVKKIGDHAFCGCNLKGFVMECDSVEIIEGMALCFSAANSEQDIEITLPNSLTTFDPSNLVYEGWGIRYIVTAGSVAEQEIINWQENNNVVIDYVVE